MNTATELLELSPVVPVVTLTDEVHAVPVARALRDAGIGVLELTLRTPVALRAVENVANEIPEIVVGAGTVTTPAQARDAAAAGAEFLVTPGSTNRLLDAVEAMALPVLAGAGSTSEAMRLAERGHTALKFFPAEAAGGPELLRGIAGPLPQLRFCPTGGIGPERAADYLTLTNVSCVGGSWLTPKETLENGDFASVEALAREARALAP